MVLNHLASPATDAGSGVSKNQGQGPRSRQDKPRVERAVRYVRGNLRPGGFTDLADAQARVEVW